MNLGKPPENISAEALFNKITSRLDDTMKAVPDAEKRIGKPLFNPKKALNDEQWHKLSKIQSTLEDEYNLRRKMLMTRLDVTIQSFKWSDKIKGKEKDINERYSNKNQVLEKLQFGGARTDIVALLAARSLLAIIEKTSSANVRKNTKSKLQRHIIGKVPDRGGRTLEQQQPPKEMPSWQKRQPGSDNRGGGRGGGRGNFNQNQNRGNFHQNQQGFPPQQLQQKTSYNPSNQQYSGDNQQSSHQGSNRGQGGSRVQGGWNRDNYNQPDNQGNSQDYNQRGGRGRGRRY